jgi:hypothetical protein
VATLANRRLLGCPSEPAPLPRWLPSLRTPEPRAR